MKSPKYALLRGTTAMAVLLLSCSGAQSNFGVRAAHTYDQNNEYRLFSAFKGSSGLSDYQLWVRSNSTGTVRLVKGVTQFVRYSVVLSAVIRDGRPLAYVAVTGSNLRGETIDTIFSLDLDHLNLKQLLVGKSGNFSFTSGGDDLALSPDSRFLAFSADRLVSIDPKVPEKMTRMQVLFRYGPLNSSVPTLSTVPNGSRIWPCTSRVGIVTACTR